MDAYLEYKGYDAIDSWNERARVSELAAAMMRIDAAGEKMKAFSAVAAGIGMSAKSAQRLYYAWKRDGDLALADKRKMRKSRAESIFYRDFKTYAERDKNTSRGGYDAMVRDLRAGKAFSFGTWRDCWSRDFPLEAVPPACPRNWTPHGLTYANMMRLLGHDPSAPMSLAWSRRGEFAAIGTRLPVLRSRVGLPVGAVYQADDVWHNIDVFAPGVTGLFQPLEFAIYDVASAYKAVSVIKPRILRVDENGKEVRDNLKEKQFRFAMGYLACEVGFHRAGVTFILERGTTAIRENVQARVAAIPGYGRLFHFQTSGVKNAPAFAGLFIGNCGGNPRMKSLCECAHNILHNATAGLPGSRGRDAAHMHESRAALARYSEGLIEQARRIDPALLALLDLPVLDLTAYRQYFYALEAEVMDRTDHSLEGWADREVAEYRLSENSDEWIPVSALLDMDPDSAAATKAVLARNPAALMRKRKMSRREVWRAGQAELVKLPAYEMPAFLDPRDMAQATVRADGTIMLQDALYYPGEKKFYIAETIDRNGLRRRVAPGTKVRFFWNPLGNLSRWIWLADEEGGVTGMCPALKTAAWCDPESVKISMGQQQHQIAETMSDARARHSGDAARHGAALAYNAALIEAAGRMPRPAQPIAPDGAAASPEELMGGETQPRQGAKPALTFEELAGV